MYSTNTNTKSTIVNFILLSCVIVTNAGGNAPAKTAQHVAYGASDNVIVKTPSYLSGKPVEKLSKNAKSEELFSKGLYDSSKANYVAADNIADSSKKSLYYQEQNVHSLRTTVAQLEARIAQNTKEAGRGNFGSYFYSTAEQKAGFRAKKIRLADEAAALQQQLGEARSALHLKESPKLNDLKGESIGANKVRNLYADKSSIHHASTNAHSDNKQSIISSNLATAGLVTGGVVVAGALAYEFSKGQRCFLLDGITPNYATRNRACQHQWAARGIHPQTYANVAYGGPAVSGPGYI